MRLATPEKLEAGRVLDGKVASTSAYGTTGVFFVTGPEEEELLMVGSSDEAWEHVSVSCQHRAPNWLEMCFVKDLFWGEDEVVIQLHLNSEYLNAHSRCLHLWRRVGSNKNDLPSQVAVKSKSQITPEPDK